MPGRDWGCRWVHQVVVTGAEHAAATQNPRRGSAGRSARRAGPCACLPEPVGISVQASHRRRLEVQRIVDKVFGWPERYRWRSIRKRVPGGWRRRAVQWLLKGVSVSRSTRLDLWRRWLPRWNCWRIIIRL